MSLQLADKNPILDRAYLNKLKTPVGFYAGGWGVAEHERANGTVLSHNGSNGIWYSSLVVAPKLNRAYVVVTNSRDFGETEDICTGMINTLIKMSIKR